MIQGVPKKWSVSLLLQQANGPFFLGHPVGERPTSICYRNRFVKILAMWTGMDDWNG